MTMYSAFNPGKTKAYIQIYPTKCFDHPDEYCECPRKPVQTIEVEPGETKEYISLI